MIFFSPAKVNCFLRLLTIREDGYHEIATLMQAINLFDVLSVELADVDSFTCTNNELPIDKSNLVVRALLAFRLKFKRNFHVKIHLKKNIPISAGLGGGSSNAATTLFALNELLGRRLKLSDLIDLGKGIGSDVPFFFSSGRGYCKGRGEIIEDLEEKKLEGYLAKPSFGLSTNNVYLNSCVEHLIQLDPDLLCSSHQRENYTDAPYMNDLEKGAYFLQPTLLELKNKLFLSGFRKVVLTGSGSSFFCIGKSEAPIIEGVSFYKIKSIKRNAQSWYSN